MLTGVKSETQRWNAGIKAEKGVMDNLTLIIVNQLGQSMPHALSCMRLVIENFQQLVWRQAGAGARDTLLSLPAAILQICNQARSSPPDCRDAVVYLRHATSFQVQSESDTVSTRAVQWLN